MRPPATTGAAPTSAWLGPPHLFGVLLVLAVGLASAWAPAAMAVAVVLLGAGPHNWCEARYLMSRMPGRWGPLRAYFLVAMGGVGALTAGFVGLAWVPTGGDLVWLAVWHTAVIGWVAVLLAVRQRQPPRRDWLWLVPPGLLCLAAAWAAPLWVSVALVYVHPLLALAFLDRELAVRRVPWLPAYRMTLGVLPVAIALIWWTVSTVEAATLATRPEATQAGAFLLPDHLSGAVLATHVFLESLHYLAWIVAIPMATGAVPWDLRRVPLSARSAGWRSLLATVLAAGLACVIALWIAFALDYETTRQVYFTVAIAHVLAEVPFLIRLL